MRTLTLVALLALLLAGCASDSSEEASPQATPGEVEEPFQLLEEGSFVEGAERLLQWTVHPDLHRGSIEVAVEAIAGPQYVLTNFQGRLVHEYNNTTTELWASGATIASATSGCVYCDSSPPPGDYTLELSGQGTATYRVAVNLRYA